MEINTFVDQLRKYLNSIFFPLTLALLSFLIWVLPLAGSWVFSMIFCLLCFLPLLGEDGRGYIPLLLMPMILSNQDISFVSVPIYLYLIAACILISMILRIVLYKTPFRRGDLIVSLGIMFGVFLISYFYNSAHNGIADANSIFFLLGFFGILLIYILLSVLLGRNETIHYLSESIAILGLTIFAEVLVFYLRNGFEFSPDNFTLGWSYTIQSASTLMVLSLPFFSILISNRNPFWLIGQIAVIAGVIFLTADSGILALLFSFVPLVLLTYRKYGKFYPFIVMVLLVSIGTAMLIMLATNTRFNTKVMSALQSLNFFNERDETRKLLFQTAADNFKINPVIGTSISSFSTDRNVFVFSGNTILSVLVLGGTIGFVAWAFYEINLYRICLQKNSPEKWLFFLFLLMFELIGLVDNTLTNFAILLLFLVANAVYQMSDRPDDVLVHADDFEKRPYEM